MELECWDSIQSLKGEKAAKLTGPPGKKQRAFCPKDCDKKLPDKEDVIYGTQFYSNLSMICKAAIHNGKINKDKGGEFTIVLGTKAKTFYGTTNNGI